MSKCGKCSVELRIGEVTLKCVDCNVTFHPVCTRVGVVQNLTKTKIKFWKCDTCKSESASVQSNEDVGEDRKSILEALNVMKTEMISNVDAKMGRIEKTVNKKCDEIKELNVKVNNLEEEQCKLKARCDGSEHERDRLSGEVRDLRLRVLDADQYPRRPISKYRFISRSVRDEWFAASRKNNLQSTDIAAALPPSRIYTNEHLTAENKALLGKDRRLLRERELYFAGYINQSSGKVLVKRREGDNARRVITLDDLDTFIRESR
ncbi:hypothetical protein J6590_073653 [Homalodisca vitripennis]|nr:hypothetical protein J6590_073653 [Homalodisca vitripennis]